MALCPILASMSLGNAVNVANKVRDEDAKPARELISKAAGLDSRITDATTSRSGLPHQLPQVTEAMATAGQAAVDAAEPARRSAGSSAGSAATGRPTRLRR
jgi:hypothetical protein